MKVFVDHHHGDLLYSLHLLFEKRLQMELYRPIGQEWFNEGFWKIAEPYDNAPGTIAQFLVMGAPAPDGTKPLNTDPHYVDGEPQRLMTLDEFKEADIDIVIASYLPHVSVYRDLITRYKPKAKLIHQMGNDWAEQVDYSKVKNLLVSCAPFKVPDGVNAVFYHQEFDSGVFRYEPPEQTKKITSFVYKRPGSEDDILTENLAKELHGWNVQHLGYSINGHENIAKEMHECMFGLHLKEGGDGFGHIIHNWFACGRPPIVKYEQYKGKLAGELMTDMETCVFIDGLTPSEAAKKIIEASTPEIHEKLCKGAYNAFGSNVNYDKEQEEIIRFMEALL